MSRSASPTARIAPVTAAVGGLAALLWGLGHSAPPLLGEGPWWWWFLVVVAGVCLTESVQLHVEVRRHTISLSLSEIPLVLGLVTLSPLRLLAARLLGWLVVEAVRRSGSYRTSFNLLLLVAEVGLLELVYGLVAPPDRVFDLQVWLACYAATLAASVLTGALVSVAVVRLQGALPQAEALVAMGSLLCSALTGTTVALLVVVVARADPQALVLLAVLLGVLVLAYRAHNRLLRRHRTLELMHEFTAEMSTAGGLSTLVSDALRHTRRLLAADAAALVLHPEPDGAVRGTLQRGDSECELPRLGGGLVAQVLATGRPAVVPRGARDPSLAAWLAAQGLRDAVVVPLRGAEGVVGVLLVGDRLGEMATFGPDDLQLLQMVSAHVEIALRSGSLVDRLRHEATHDALTGLPNRTLFQERLGQAIADHRRGAVLLMDLDEFKDVNDTLGHHSGDRMLCEVAARLSSAVSSDITVARLGGDEFALLVPSGPAPAPDTASPGGAERLADQLHRTLLRPFAVEGVSLEIRASVGVALFPEHGADGTVLLQRADVAMYAAKADRTPVRVYDPELDQSSPRRLALIGELRQGIDDAQLVCHYQPKVSLPDRTITGVEALVRWQHPTMGLVPPDDFIPVAEHTGLIVPLTSVVLRTALRQCAAWLAAGQSLGVAVNVSPRGLLAEDFVSEVAALLAETGVPAQLLTLEITESSIMTDPKRATTVLARLHDLGVTLSVDDFGTGYSSLAYLQRLPVQEVKIDKDFVLNLVTDASKAAIVRAIVDLGHTLGLRVVAEGVEDQRSLELLTEYGCDTAQGYLVSRPLGAQAATGWLAEPVSWGRPSPTRPRLVASG